MENHCFLYFRTPPCVKQEGTIMVDSTQPPTRGPGRPPVRSEDETRALIIAAAAKAFLETGYVRTGIDTIARDAGVSSIGVTTLTRPSSMVTSMPRPPNSPLVWTCMSW